MKQSVQNVIPEMCMKIIKVQNHEIKRSNNENEDKKLENTKCVFCDKEFNQKPNLT